MGHKKVGVPSRRYTNEFTVEAVRLAQSVGCSEASRRLGIPESSLFNWIKRERAGNLVLPATLSATPRSAKELEAEVDRLRRELASAKTDNDILKKTAAYFGQGSTVKYAGIKAHSGWQPVARLCTVLGVSRSGFLQWCARGSSKRELTNQFLNAQVAVIHAEGKQGYGRIRVTPRLRQSGMLVSAERLRKTLVRQHLRTVYRRPYRITTDCNHRSRYASDEYRKLISQFRMTQSMSRKGNCWDNAPMESFFKTLKVERTYRLQCSSRAQARLDVVNWTEGFYNEKRLHSAIDYRSPEDFERSLKAA